MGQTPYKVPHQRLHKVVVASIWKDTSHPILWGKHKLEQWNTTMQLWKWQSLSCVQLCKPWTFTRQAPVSTGFSRQEHWSGLPFPSPRGSSWPREWTWVSCIAGRFSTIWATREDQMAKIPNTENIVCENAKQLELSYIAAGKQQNCTAALVGSLVASYV